MIKVFRATDKLYETNGDIVLNPTKASVHKEDNGAFYLELETPLSYKTNEKLTAIQGTTANSTDNAVYINNLNTNLQSKAKSSTSQTITVMGKNLFDKNNLQELNAYFSTGTGTITSNTSNYTLYVPCQASTTYTITIADGGGTFAFGYTDISPAIGVSVSGRTTNKTLTTGSSAKYLVCRYFHSGNATKTKNEILNSIQIEKNNSA